MTEQTLCTNWRAGSPRAVPVPAASTEQDWASRDEAALSEAMERLIGRGYVRFTTRQLGALRQHPNAGEQR